MPYIADKTEEALSEFKVFGFSKGSATNDEVMEKVSRSYNETKTKSTSHRDSPGTIIGPLGYSEASATNDE